MILVLSQEMPRFVKSLFGGSGAEKVQIRGAVYDVPHDLPHNPNIFLRFKKRGTIMEPRKKAIVC